MAVVPTVLHRDSGNPRRTGDGPKMALKLSPTALPLLKMVLGCESSSANTFSAATGSRQRQVGDYNTCPGSRGVQYLRINGNVQKTLARHTEIKIATTSKMAYLATHARGASPTALKMPPALPKEITMVGAVAKVYP